MTLETGSLATKREDQAGITFSAAVLNTHIQREKHRNTTDTVSVSTEQTHSLHSRYSKITVKRFQVF